MKTYFVVMERREDPKEDRPIFVGRTLEEADVAVDMRCEQMAGVHAIVRRNRFEA